MPKVSEPHLPGVSLVILCQVPEDVLSFWLLSRGYYIEVKVVGCTAIILGKLQACYLWITCPGC